MTDLGDACDKKESHRRHRTKSESPAEHLLAVQPQAEEKLPRSLTAPGVGSAWLRIHTPSLSQPSPLQTRQLSYECTAEGVIMDGRGSSTPAAAKSVVQRLDTKQGVSRQRPPHSLRSYACVPQRCDLNCILPKDLAKNVLSPVDQRTAIFLTPQMDAQAIFAKLFVDIGVEGFVMRLMRYSRMDLFFLSRAPQGP